MLDHQRRADCVDRENLRELRWIELQQRFLRSDPARVQQTGSADYELGPTLRAGRCRGRDGGRDGDRRPPREESNDLKIDTVSADVVDESIDVDLVEATIEGSDES